jgi:subtilisin family serine protease
VSRVPNDPFVPSQWLLRTVSGHDAHVEAAWDVTTGDSTVLIGIADTGVDWQHPDLGGAPPYLTGAVYTNWAEAAGDSGVDDDQNGYVDDVRGWDFVDSTEVWPGEDGTVPDNDPADFDGHGTQVAGVASALTDNGVGIAGVGWRCKILPLRIGFAADDGTGHEGGFVDMDFAASAIVYATDRGAAAVNCSWESAYSDALDAAVSYAVAAGVAVVVAGGNAGQDTQSGNWLSTRGDCIDIAATDSFDVRASFSSYGTWVDVSAPGVKIYTTCYLNTTQEHIYCYNGGTSFAAPVVSGVVALMRAAHPTATLEETRERLLATADPIDVFNAGAAFGKLGWGRVNAARAVGDSASGWQTALPGAVRTSLALADLDASARGAVIVTSDDGTVTALRAGGGALPGWPIALGATPGTPAVGRLGGMQAVIVGATDSLLHVFRTDGTVPLGWPARIGSAIRSNPSLGVVRAGGAAVVFVGTESGGVWALDANGTPLSGWPQMTRGVVRAAPTLVDLDRDSLAEVVVGSADSMIYAWRESGVPLSGWPVHVSGQVTTQVAAGDLVGAGESDIVACASDGSVWALRPDGRVLNGWPVVIGGTPSPPALVDMDGDGSLEVLAGAGSSLYVFRANGTLVTGWPVNVAGTILSSPLAADVDGVGGVDVLVGTNNAVPGTPRGLVYAFDASGTLLPGWPRTLGGSVRGAPVIGDAGGDGVPDVTVAGTDGWIVSWPVPGAPRTIEQLPWPMFAHDASRTGRYGPPPTTDARPPRADDGTRTERDIRLRPIRTPTKAPVAFVLHAATEHRLALVIFDVAGHVARRIERTAIPGTNRVIWDGRDDHGRRAPCGIYTVRALIDGHSDLRATRLVLLR